MGVSCMPPPSRRHGKEDTTRHACARGTPNIRLVMTVSDHTKGDKDSTWLLCPPLCGIDEGIPWGTVSTKVCVARPLPDTTVTHARAHGDTCLSTPTLCTPGLPRGRTSL